MPDLDRWAELSAVNGSTGVLISELLGPVDGPYRDLFSPIRVIPDRVPAEASLPRRGVIWSWLTPEVRP